MIELSVASDTGLVLGVGVVLARRYFYAGAPRISLHAKVRPGLPRPDIANCDQHFYNIDCDYKVYISTESVYIDWSGQRSADTVAGFCEVLFYVDDNRFVGASIENLTGLEMEHVYFFLD